MDQANSLRELLHDTNIDKTEIKAFNNSRVLAVTSGKGGVGKSNFVANLAINLQQRGNSVLIIDADVGLANIELLFDIMPRKTFKNLLQGEDINSVLSEGPFGIKLLSGGSGIVELSNISQREQNIILQTFSYLEDQFDFIIIDTGAGISDLVIKFLSLADEVIVVTLPEPTAITDAYALLKVANSVDGHNIKNFSIVVNRVANFDEGEFVVRKLSLVAKKFLNLDVSGLGSLSEDNALIQSVKRQNIMELYKNKSNYVTDIEAIVNKLLNVDKAEESFEVATNGKLITRFRKIFGK